MYALTPVRLVRVPLPVFLSHICKHVGTTTEVVEVDTEAQSTAHEDGIAGGQVEFWVLRYGATFIRRLDVGIDEWCMPRPFGRCRRSGWAEIRIIYPSFRVEEENILEEIQSSVLMKQKPWDH